MTSHQRWDNILKNIEKPIYWSYWYWYWYWNMQFRNIDIDIDIEICLIEILIPILILKIFCILILVLILILVNLDQYFLDFHIILTGVTQPLQNKFYQFAYTLLIKSLSFTTSFDSFCHVRENAYYVNCNHRKTLFIHLQKFRIFIIRHGKM